MIMKNIYLILVTVFVIVLSCTEGKMQKISNPDLHVIDIDASELLIDMKTSQLFKKVTPIILEVTPNSLLKGILKLCVMNDLLIIMDINHTSILVFNRDGKFLHKIGGHGQGPGEYTDISDFCVDTVSKTIYLSDFNTKKIHHYDLYSGKYLKSIKVNTNITNWYIYYHENELYISGRDFHDKSKEGFLLHKIDINSGKTKEAWFDFRDYNKGLNNIQQPFLHTNQKDMKFATNLMDTVMSISGNRIMPFLTFTDKYKTTKDDVKNIDISDLSRNVSYFTSLNKINVLDNYFECPDFLFLKLYTGAHGRVILYYPKTKQAKRLGSFIDDLVYSNQQRTMPIFLTADQNGLYTYIHTIFIDKFIETRDKGELSLSMSNNLEIQRLDEDANPIIFYYEFKDEE
jgi:hypothetical protein